MGQDVLGAWEPTQAARPFASGEERALDAQWSLLAALKWVGTACGIVGAVIIAIKSPVAGYGFVLLAVSALSWTAAALLMGERPLAILQGAFIAINLVGIYTWLLR